MAQAAAPGSFGEEGGLTLQQYAELGVALFGREGAERDAILQAHGLDAARLDAANTAWMARLQRDPAAALAYNDLYQWAMVSAGVQRPDVPLETYAQMLREISGGTPTADVCTAHGMDLQQFALLSQFWSMQLAGNPELAARFATAMTGAGPTMPTTPAPGAGAEPPAGTPPAIGPII
jgi:hypothetical protein